MRLQRQLPRSVVEKRYRRQLNERSKRYASRCGEVEIVLPQAREQAKPKFLDENVLRRQIARFLDTRR